MKRKASYKPFLLPALACAIAWGAALETFAGTPQSSGKAGIKLPDGTVISAELAVTAEQHEKGLMFRKELPPLTGMLFIFPDSVVRTFWMKNTYVDLDIIFIDRAFRVLKIFHGVTKTYDGQPEYEISRVSSVAKYVLEVPSGTARAKGIKPGIKLEVSFDRNMPAAKKRDVKAPAGAGVKR